MKRTLTFILCALLLAASLPPQAARANSAEPPAIIILVANPPEDLAVQFYADGRPMEMGIKTVAWESYYVVYHSQMWNAQELRIEVQTGGERFGLTLMEDKFEAYNTAYTLDITNRTLLPGISPARDTLLIALRVTLTLALEGLCLYVFGFRQPRSYVVFLIINLVTQTWLNIALSGLNPFTSYPAFSLIFAEIPVFLVEIIAFTILLREHTKPRRAAYAFLANLFSLILGGFLITMLPI